MGFFSIAFLIALQFILYLASENADIQDIPQSQPPRPRKKRGQILDKASEVKEKATGVRIGNAIRKIKLPSHSSSQGGTGAKVRPHSRRGHWHHYWTGPRDGDRRLVLKWTGPRPYFFHPRRTSATHIRGSCGLEHLPLPLPHELLHLRRGVAVVPAPDLDDLPAAHLHRVEGLV